jgi:hypothetical protein
VRTSKTPLYKVARTPAEPERALPTVRASLKAEPETPAPYKIANAQPEIAVAAETQAVEAVSLDALVDTASSAS